MTMRVPPVGCDDGSARLAAATDLRRDATNIKTAEARADGATVDPAPVDGSAPGDTPEIERENPHDRKAPGVLRLLEAGHFKGVADVRLRINFFEELSAGAAERAQAAAGERSAKLVETVTAGVDGLLDTADVDETTGELVAGAVGEFETGVTEALEEFTSAGVPNADSLASGIQSSFDALISTLVEAMTPPAQVPDSTPDSKTDGATGTDVEASPLAVEEGQIAAAPDTPAVPTLDELIASLVDSFEQALASLITAIVDASSLPDPSEPTGNGAAYDKFLDIYNELRGLSGTVDDVG